MLKEQPCRQVILATSGPRVPVHGDRVPGGPRKTNAGVRPQRGIFATARDCQTWRFAGQAFRGFCLPYADQPCPGPGILASHVIRVNTETASQICTQVRVQTKRSFLTTQYQIFTKCLLQDKKGIPPAFALSPLSSKSLETFRTTFPLHPQFARLPSTTLLNSLVSISNAGTPNHLRTFLISGINNGAHTAMIMTPSSILRHFNLGISSHITSLIP